MRPAEQETILLPHLPYLRRFAFSLVHDRDHADGLVEEALIHAIGLLHQWKPGTNLRAWLFGILYRAYVGNIWRYAADAGEGIYRSVRREPGHAASQREKLQHGLLALPHEQRVVLFLIALEGMTYGEAAAVTGAPVASIKASLTAARSTLRESMDDSNKAPSGPSV